MGDLIFARPTSGPISTVFNKNRTKKDEKTGKTIKYKHKGTDFADKLGAPIKACERGVVIAVDTGIPGYGKFVIIDHTPNAKDSERHIYTLYAHMDTLGVKLHEKIDREEIIGTVGHTGCSYSTTGGDPNHLHLEVTDCPWKAERLDMLSKTGKARIYRKDPISYINIKKTVNGTIGDKELSADLLERLKDRLDAKPFFDPDGNITHADIYLAEKRLGTVNPGSDSFEIKLLKEDLKKLLYRSRPNPGNPQVKLEVEVSTT